MQEEPTSLGKRLRQFRKSKDLTQHEFADMLGSSQGFLSEIESDKKMPGAEILISLIKCFNLDTNWLLTGKIGNDTPSEKNDISDKDIPKEQIKGWLDDFWTTATDEEKVWLKVELQRIFPEFKNWGL